MPVVDLWRGNLMLCTSQPEHQLGYNSHRPSKPTSSGARLTCRMAGLDCEICALRLPNELLVGILVDVPVADMVRCRAVGRLTPYRSQRLTSVKVCRQFKDIVDATPALQYRLELLLAGMVPVEGAENTTTAALLSELLKRRKAWETFRPTSSDEFDEPHPRRSLTDPYFNRTKETFVHKNIAAVRKPDMRTLAFYQVSPQPMWGLPKCWEISDLGFCARNVTMSPEQDLLVLIEELYTLDETVDGIKVHLLSLRTGSPHPCADNPVISLQHAELDLYASRVYVYGTFLGVMSAGCSWEDQTELWIIDWRHGVTFLVSPSRLNWAALEA